MSDDSTASAEQPDSTKEILADLLRKGYLKSWLTTWQRFIESEANRRWYERWPAEAPHYALPLEVVTSLSLPGEVSRRRSAQNLFTKKDLAAELNFSKCCRSWSSDTVGVWDGIPIQHALLGSGRRCEMPSDDTLKGLNWNEPIEKTKEFLNALDEKELVEHRNQLREAGELVCKTDFLHDRNELRGAVQGLPIKFVFPLHRVKLLYTTLPGKTVTEDIVRPVAARIWGFLAHYNLNHLDTWDLMAPVGRYTAMPARAFENLYPGCVLANIQPVYHAIPVKDAPSAVGRLELGHPGTFEPNCNLLPRGNDQAVGSPTPVASVGPERRPAIRPDVLDHYEWVYRLWFAELAFRSRYRTPYGYRSVLTRAFVDWTGLGEERVTKLVETYRPSI